MALEAGDGFISGLVATNPVNATDQVAQGDDHLRLIKTALKGTFPNLNAAVTSSPAELNILDGATLSTAELNILDGVTLSASQINDAARKSASNDFTAAQQITATAGNRAALRLAGNGNTAGATSFDIFQESNDSGNIVQNKNAPIYIWRNGGVVMEFNTSNGFDFKGGAVTTNKAAATEVGTLGVPRVSKTADYTIAAVDSGTELVLTSAADDITVQASGQPAAGCVVFLENGTGGSVDIIQGSGMTLTLDGTATTGSRTLAANGRAYVRFTGAGTASVGGLGVA
jgi:hypothetical protein